MKLRSQSLLVLLALSVLTSIVLGALSLRLMRSSARERSIQRIEAEVDLLADTLKLFVAERDLQSFAVNARRDLGFRVTLMDGTGVVLADSSLDRQGVAGMENHLDRPEVQQAIRSGRGDSLRLSATTGVEYYYTARTVEGGEPVAFVRLALPSSQLERVSRAARTTFWVGIVAALLLHTAVAYLLVRRLSVRVERVARQLGASDAGVPAHVQYRGSHEVGALAAAVNRVERNLEEKIEQLESEQHLLSAAVSGMKEALVVVGPDRRILLANEAFRRLFQPAEEPVGRLLGQVVRNPTVLRDLDHALGEGDELHETTVHAPELDRSFELHVTPFENGASPSAGGAIILFFDITRLERLESVRRDFVANVSHELRTPLTSVKAFVETLLDEELEDREHGLEFLRIVRKHVGRMEALIDDLTDLSLIETGAISLEVHEIDAGVVASEVVSQLAHRHRDSTVRLHNEIPSPFPVRADRRRLEQILVNLVDNAIKFNRPEGTVRLGASRQDGSVLLTVADTGAGIPSDSIEKVFHRFYRVDKARSREVGGTGLGLAIVKHLMRLHGGSVRLESEVGQGSTFTLEFPGGARLRPVANGEPVSGGGS
jgi:two-component system phosphate regulon sensor histidine kinase PhoR